MDASSFVVLPVMSESREKGHIIDRMIGAAGLEVKSRLIQIQSNIDDLKKRTSGLGKKIEEKFNKYLKENDIDERDLAKRKEKLEKKNLEELRKIDCFLGNVMAKVEMRKIAAEGLNKIKSLTYKNIVVESFEEKLSEFEDDLDKDLDIEKYDTVKCRMEQMAREFAEYSEMVQRLIDEGRNSFENADPLVDQTVVYDRSDKTTDEFVYWYRIYEGYPVLYCFDRYKERTAKFDPLTCFKHFVGKGLINGEKWGENAWVYVDIKPSEYGGSFDGEMLLHESEKGLTKPNKDDLIAARKKVLEENYDARDKFGTHKWNSKWNLTEEQKQKAREQQKLTLRYMKGEERNFFDNKEEEKKIWEKRIAIRDANLYEFDEEYDTSYGAKGAQIDGWNKTDIAIDQKLFSKPIQKVTEREITVSQYVGDNKTYNLDSVYLSFQRSTDEENEIEVVTSEGKRKVATLKVDDDGEINLKSKEKEFNNKVKFGLKNNTIVFTQLVPIITQNVMDSDRRPKITVRLPSSDDKLFTVKYDYTSGDNRDIEVDADLHCKLYSKDRAKSEEIGKLDFNLKGKPVLINPSNSLESQDYRIEMTEHDLLIKKNGFPRIFVDEGNRKQFHFILDEHSYSSLYILDTKIRNLQFGEFDHVAEELPILFKEREVARLKIRKAKKDFICISSVFPLKVEIESNKIIVKSSLITAAVGREGMPPLRGIVYDIGSDIVVRTKDGDTVISKADVRSVRPVDPTYEEIELAKRAAPLAIPSTPDVVSTPTPAVAPTPTPTPRRLAAVVERESGSPIRGIVYDRGAEIFVRTGEGKEIRIAKADVKKIRSLPDTDMTPAEKEQAEKLVPKLHTLFEVSDIITNNKWLEVSKPDKVYVITTDGYIFQKDDTAHKIWIINESSSVKIGQLEFEPGGEEIIFTPESDHISAIVLQEPDTDVSTIINLSITD